jgi:2-phospho-L-lactate guanylyltransferase
VRLVTAVPVKDLAHAKQRLLPALSAGERHRLAAAMLEDVLQALAEAAPGPVWVVSRDDEVQDLARRFGAECLLEATNRGHTEAVALAQDEAARRGVEAFLTLPGDVPCATAEEIRALAGSLGPGPGVAFVPSLSGFGTNAALLRPPHAMPLKFGEPSFGNHLDAARERGLAPVVLRLPGIGLDVDGPEDLALLLQRGGGTRSAALLASLGFPARPARPH